MLEILAKFICSSMIAVVGFFVIKKILKKKIKLYNIKTILYLLMLIMISLIIRPIEYTVLYSITIFLLNILIYKLIFELSFEESTLSVALLMFITVLGDLFISIIFNNFFDLNIIRSTPILFVLSNLLVCVVILIIININKINDKLHQFYLAALTKKSIINIIFLIVLVIELTLLTYNISVSWNFSSNYVINIIIMIMLGVIAWIFINNKNSYNKLISEYDNLFNYIQNFEDWIEKEQLNRHEYKNQLAVLRDITKENKMKKKIDEILEDNISIEGEVVNQLKYLPKGGIKGLMYYKLVIAQKNKIDLTVDVSIKKASILNKLSEKQIRDLCKLIGIYFDNAIEAARQTKKKTVLVEIYELKDKVNIVISNTFKKTKNFDKRNEKGVSSKGKGHGNGLYFASKLISKNKWLKEEQKIIDRYYIEQLSILKLED